MKRVMSFCDKHYTEQEQEVSTDNEPVVRLALDGREIEIDLCPECRAELDGLMVPYLEAGRRPDNLPAPKVRQTRTKGEKGQCEYCDKMVVKGSGGAALHIKGAHPKEWAVILKNKAAAEKAATKERVSASA